MRHLLHAIFLGWWESISWLKVFIHESYLEDEAMGSYADRAVEKSKLRKICSEP